MKSIGVFLWNIIETIAHAVLSVIYKIFRRELSDEEFGKWLQFIKFGMVGVLNTILSYIITEVGYFCLKKAINSDALAMQISQTAAFIITVFISFLLNNAFVFTKGEGEKRNPLKTLLKTYVAYSVTGIFLNNILIYFELNMLHISPLIAPIINLLVDVPVNFFMNKLWAYKTE